MKTTEKTLEPHTAHAHRGLSALGPAAASPISLAFSATWHCLVGCGLGEIAGTVIGTDLGWGMTQTLVAAVLLGFIFGFALGMRPLLRAGWGFRRAWKQVLLVEGLSIAVMETAQVLVEVYTPGVMTAGLREPLFWGGMGLALTAGFAAAFPINYYFARRGIQHVH